MSETVRPTTEQLRQELLREKRRSAFAKSLRGTIFVLLVIAAIAVLCSTFFLCVLRIEGGSMDPTLNEKQYVLAVKTGRFSQGDIVAFYYNNRILLKRVIGVPGDWVEIDSEGNVTVNGETLSEPYVQGKCLGDGDITYPFQVPENQWFVLGDHRDTSLDSRYSIIGTASADQIEGRVIFRIWPMDAFGPVNVTKEN